VAGAEALAEVEVVALAAAVVQALTGVVVFAVVVVQVLEQQYAAGPGLRWRGGFLRLGQLCYFVPVL